jgi:hypothetical protein
MIRKSSPFWPLPPWRLCLGRMMLALCLVSAQYAATLHFLSHDLEQIGAHDDKQLPHEELCAKCVAFAHVGHGLASGCSVPPPQALTLAAPVTPIQLTRDANVELAYRSRAPPEFL